MTAPRPPGAGRRRCNECVTLGSSATTGGVRRRADATASEWSPGANGIGVAERSQSDRTTVLSEGIDVTGTFASDCRRSMTGGSGYSGTVRGHLRPMGVWRV